MFTGVGPGREDGVPSREQAQAWHRRMTVPENEVPGSADVSVLLARTESVAVALGDLQGFSAGFRFVLMVRARRPLPPGHRLFELLSGHPLPGGPAAEGQLLLGVEFADGRRASTLDAQREPWSGDAAGADDVVLFPQGGGGGELAVDHAYWVSPLPPAGPLTFVLAWGAFGIGEARAVVDAGQVLAASGRSVVLWEPQPEPHDAPLPPPERPSSGWFAAEPGASPEGGPQSRG